MTLSGFWNSHHVPPHIFIFSLETFDTATWDKVTRYLTLQSPAGVSNSTQQSAFITSTYLYAQDSFNIYQLKFIEESRPIIWNNFAYCFETDKPTKEITYGQEMKVRCGGRRLMHHRGTP